MIWIRNLFGFLKMHAEGFWSSSRCFEERRRVSRSNPRFVKCFDIFCISTQFSSTLWTSFRSSRWHSSWSLNKRHTCKDMWINPATSATDMAAVLLSSRILNAEERKIAMVCICRNVNPGFWKNKRKSESGPVVNSDTTLKTVAPSETETKCVPLLANRRSKAPHRAIAYF